MDFGRVATAMVTPFNTNGDVCRERLTVLIHHLIENGTDSLVVCGTTGESPVLSHREKVQLFRDTLEIVDGRVPVIAGTGSNDTKSTVEFSKEAAKLGVDALLLVTPYYNRPSQDGLFAHFRAVADEVDVPIMLYNVPGRTSVNLDVDTLLRLAELQNITAVKEASGNFGQIVRIAAEKPKDFVLYSGDDKFTLPMLALGARGIVSVASHVAGSKIQDMIRAFEDGRHVEAALYNSELLPIFEAMFAVASPAPVKAALQLQGIDTGDVRLPLLSAPEELQNDLKTLLERL